MLMENSDNITWRDIYLFLGILIPVFIVDFNAGSLGISKSFVNLFATYYITTFLCIV